MAAPAPSAGGGGGGSESSVWDTGPSGSFNQTGIFTPVMWAGVGERGVDPALIPPAGCQQQAGSRELHCGPGFVGEAGEVAEAQGCCDSLRTEQLFGAKSGLRPRVPVLVKAPDICPQPGVWDGPGSCGETTSSPHRRPWPSGREGGRPGLSGLWRGGRAPRWSARWGQTTPTASPCPGCGLSLSSSRPP